MGVQTVSPFDGIESAHEFLKIMFEVVEETRKDVGHDVEREAGSPSRHLDAMRMALYNMEKLEFHVRKSIRLLNDLRSLRRLLFQERKPAATAKPKAAPIAAGTPMGRPAPNAKASLPLPGDKHLPVNAA